MSAGGEQYKHGLAIDAKFGAGTADMLDDLSRISVRLSEKELKEMRIEFQLRLKNLESEKSI